MGRRLWFFFFPPGKAGSWCCIPQHHYGRKDVLCGYSDYELLDMRHVVLFEGDVPDGTMRWN